jgi:hypothetical protein
MTKLFSILSIAQDVLEYVLTVLKLIKDKKTEN